jgi:hypothetical protein|tara:strand:+ start:3427 stop:3795 length:369 start_codon:yes stop_codon:yes gene_type:complete
MNLNKIFLDVTNDKRFVEWAKAMKKKIKNNPAALAHFEQNYAVVRNGMFLPRASFVMYWEMFNSDNLARLAPAISQASMIHMLHRLMEQNKNEESAVMQTMMINYVRMMNSIEQGAASDEEE